MLDYASLSALAAVIREGSFDRAALALHVTPSAVSQRIRLLEERIGCALVVRDQPCRATETGRRLCQHVDRVRLLEQALQGTLPALAAEGIATLPSSQAFVTAAVAGMGWGMQPQALIAPHLRDGSLVELVPETALDVPLYWQHARAATELLDALSRQVLAAA